MRKLIIHEGEGKVIRGKGFRIIELINPDMLSSKNVSFASVIVNSGAKISAHYHGKMEEIYFILEGKGLTTIDNKSTNVKAGDAIYIPPRAVHGIKNTGRNLLRFVVISSPPYSPEDDFRT